MLASEYFDDVPEQMFGPTPPAEQRAALLTRAFCERNFDLIVGTSFGYLDAQASRQCRRLFLPQSFRLFPFRRRCRSLSFVPRFIVVVSRRRDNDNATRISRYIATSPSTYGQTFPTATQNDDFNRHTRAARASARFGGTQRAVT